MVLSPSQVCDTVYDVFCTPPYLYVPCNVLRAGFPFSIC